MTKMRKEQDALGELEVPAEAYWGISTQRAIKNFKISGRPFPEDFIRALGKVKKACLLANLDLKELDSDLGAALRKAVDEIIKEDKFIDQFPIDYFQTGSGTQTNMNMNEVLANRANEILGHPLGKKQPVHPNDHVNRSQSSNDVIPTAMHVAALESLTKEMMPAVDHLVNILGEKIKEFEGIVKVGRTHLQDAVPIPLSLELDVYRTQMIGNYGELQSVRDELGVVPLGGTALGTGINTVKGFAEKAVSHLAKITKFPLQTHPVKAEGIASHRVMVRLSSALRQIALSALKMANDLRWMGSGPRAGLGEVILPQNEPGSSIMPGKVNPTQAEALIQVCAQVIGHDAAVSFAESHGSILDLNVTKPVMIVNLLDAMKILSNGLRSFVDNTLKELKVNESILKAQLERSLMIVTRLTPQIGYDSAAEVAKRAFESGKTIKETILELGIEVNGDLDDLLDPTKMV
ncbi:MAG: class II fumarate hydratase [Candidatus Hodarchaeota archaeon]